MAQKHINTSTPNDNLGDTLRDANIKCEDNFTELYANKVDKISGKGLSTNDYTTTEKTKLAGIPADAEKNVQSDWLVNDPDSDAFIKNKPDLISSVNWGEINGTLSDQSDLQLALDYKPTFEYVDAKVTQTINVGTTEYTPSEDAVYNALTLKEDVSDKNQANGYAGLDASGKLFSSQLPALAISETFVVASQAAMLAVSGAETGDIAVRTDINKTFILKQNPASTLTNWQELLTPTDAVTSVFGRTGAVVANAGDYTTALVTETTNKRYQTDVQAARNDATSSIQTQLDSKATDSNVVHKTGDETVTGSKVFNNTMVLNTGSATALQITTSNNRGIIASVGGANTAFDGTSASGLGVAGRSTNSTGLLAQTYNGSFIAEFYSGGSRQAYVTAAGEVNALSFRKSGGTASQYLMADGSTSTLTNPVTGTGTTNYLPKFTGSGTIGNSQIFDNAINVGIGTSSPEAKLDVNGIAIIGNNTARINIGSLDATKAFIQSKNTTINQELHLYGSKYVFNEGNVGIGTTAPTSKLDVNGSITSSNGAIFSKDAESLVLKTSTNPNKQLILGYDLVNNCSSIQSVEQTIDLRSLVLNPVGGNVGIGTTVPTEKLAVNGSIRSISDNTYFTMDSGGVSRIGFTKKAGFAPYFTYSNAEPLVIAESSGAGIEPANTFTPRLTIVNGGNVGIGTANPTAKLTLRGLNEGAALDIFNTSSNLNFRIGTGNVGGALFFENNAGSEVARLQQNGNVLIGTTTDNGVDRLQVNGTISASLASSANQVVVKSQLDAVQSSLISKASLAGSNTFTGINNFSGGVVVVTDPVNAYHAVPKNYVDSNFQPKLPYKNYVASLYQSGTNAPTATIMENSIGSIVWTRTGVGTYRGTLSGAFTTGKTTVFLNPAFGTGNVNAAQWNTSSTIDIKTLNGLSPTDGILTADIEIRVYN